MKESPVRISAVSYLNTKPFLHGLRDADSDFIQISLDTPAECARKLISGEAELGLVPVATLLQLKDYTILSDFCIGAVGAVDSVKLYAQQPLETLESIVLDYQSRTSVALTRVLAREYWKINPRWEQAQPGFEQTIGGAVGGVVIGDRTFALNGTFAVDVDLAEEWQKFTGLPFVFACWVSTRELSDEFKLQFTQYLQKGLNELDQVVAEWQPQYPHYDIERYFRHFISYNYDARKQEALALFLQKLRALDA